MPWGLKRYYGTGNLHFITWSCYRPGAPPLSRFVRQGGGFDFPILGNERKNFDALAPIPPARSYDAAMPWGLKRYQEARWPGGPHLPFVKDPLNRLGAPFLAFFARSGAFDFVAHDKPEEGSKVHWSRKTSHLVEAG